MAALPCESWADVQWGQVAVGVRRDPIGTSTHPRRDTWAIQVSVWEAEKLDGMRGYHIYSTVAIDVPRWRVYVMRKRLALLRPYAELAIHELRFYFGKSERLVPKEMAEAIRRALMLAVTAGGRGGHHIEPNPNARVYFEGA